MGLGRHIPALVVAYGLGFFAHAQVSDPVGPAPGAVGVAQADALVYEGLLVHLGTPVDGEVDMVVTAWDRPLGGAALDGPTEYAAVLVEGGWFRVALEPTLLERGRGFAWLEVSVRWPAGLGEYETLDGRQRVDFASVSFVRRESNGETARSGAPEAADGGEAAGRVRLSRPAASGRRLGAGGFDGGVAPGRVVGGGGSFGVGGDGSGGGGGSRACDWTIVGDDVYYECGNVGVGTTSPSYRLHVVSGDEHAIFGESTLATSAFAYGVWGEAASTNGRGVLGYATAGTGATAGVFGRSDSVSGRGVYGLAEAASGENYGVYGETKSAEGYAGYFKGGMNYLEGHVGIGDEPLDTNALFVYSEDKSAVFGFTHGQDAWGVYGFANGSGTSYGVIGESNNGTCVGVSGRSYGCDPSSYGVEAINGGFEGMGVYALGPTYGVYGKSVVTDGIALGGDATGSGSTFGLKVTASGSSGTGAWAQGGSVGVHASTSTSAGHAMKAEATTYGLRSTVTGSSGIAVIASATSTTGSNYGLYASASSSSGRAVRAVASSTSGTNYGVHAHSSGASGRGVYSVVTGSSGRGLYGYCSSSSSTARAVMGQATSPAVAVYAQGNSTTTGTKSFRIDHPLDPANRYLNHYCTESPQPLNVYSGNAVLDEAGEAWVELPDYFGEINRDFRYQLTTIGGWAPVYVALKIENNRFKIAGGRPGLEVSWRVEAVRNDAYVRTYGAPVEVEKAESERGRYLHPEVFGQPKELAIDYDPDPIGPLPADGEPAVRAAGD